MELITEEHINNLLTRALLGEGKKNKKQNQTVGSQEEAIKAYNKASREAEQEEHGGVLAFQHQKYTKNKKDQQSRQDRFSRKCKHKGGRCDEGREYEFVLTEGEEEYDYDEMPEGYKELYGPNYGKSIEDADYQNPEQEADPEGNLPDPDEALRYAQVLWKLCMMDEEERLPQEYRKVVSACNMIAQALGWRF